MNRAAIRRPRDWDGASTPSWVWKKFSPLFCRVSDRCINLIATTYIKVISHEFAAKCEDPWVRTCQDCHVRMRLLEPSLPRHLSLLTTSTTSGSSLTGKTLHQHRFILLVASMGSLAGSCETCGLKQITAEQLTDLYIDLEYPEKSTFAEPSVVEKVRRKGRPPGAKNKNRVEARDKSLFEHRETEARTHEKEKAKEKKTQQKESTCKRRGRPKKKDGSTTTEVIGSEELQSQPSVQYQQSKKPRPRIFHLGVDNIDAFWFPYIISAQDVCDDDHCGYRSLAVLLGFHEAEYIGVRHVIVRELIENRELYDPIRQELHEGTWEKLILQVSHCVSPCSFDYWFHMPLIGLVFATLYQVRLVLLTWYAPSLCLSLRSRIGNDAPPIATLAMTHVGEHNHFILILKFNSNSGNGTCWKTQLFHTSTCIV